MMSADPLRSAPDRTALTLDQRRLLRHAFQSGIPQSQSENGAAFGQRQAIRELCFSCRELRQSPQQLHLLFRAFIETANDCGIPPGAERTELLERLVTMFIEELYAFPLQEVAGNGNGNGTVGADHRSEFR